MRSPRFPIFGLCFSLLIATLVASSTAGTARQVNESARRIPVAFEGDVVVVGGGTGAVAAAVAAVSEGATVFLAAPHPYLGDEMTATLQLWLEEGEQPSSPLARQIYTDPLTVAADPNRLPLSYQSDVPADARHPDTSPPSRLTDGKWSDAPSESVQLNRNANIVADLTRPRDIGQVRLKFFRRRRGTPAGTGFDVQRLTVSLSDDGKSWRNVAVADNDLPLADVGTLSVAVNERARYVQLAVEKPAALQRMLLGEIEILGPPKGSAAPVTASPPRPLHVKKTLDDALLQAGVKYLYSCYPTDVLRDGDGQPCGVVMANRAGRQAVIGKTIIDATPRAVVARMAGAKFRPFPRGEHQFRRVVIGGEPREGPSMRCRVVAPPFRGRRGAFSVLEYTLSLPVDDASYAAYMRADQQARTLTYHPDQQFTSDVLLEVPPDALHGKATFDGPWPSADALPRGIFQPADVERVLVLGPCADLPRPLAQRLLRPVELIQVGSLLGREAAVEAKLIPKPVTIKLPGQVTHHPVAAGDVREVLAGVRSTEKLRTIQQDARALPVLGQYDVVVIGGGTGGAPAGIAAARHGAKTLVVEYLHGLGGVGTLGAIASYYWGNRVGFTATVLEGATKWKVEPKMEWYRRQLLEAGGEVWFGTIGCGVFAHDNRVTGAVVATPYGRGVVLAHTVIDATGNSDVAAAAGAPTMYTDATEFAMQGTGLPGRQLGGAYNNTDFTIVDETDMVDIWQVLVYAKEKYPDAFDQGRLIDTRERRRIRGDFVIQLCDEINQRTYRDSVVRCWTNFDTHGYTVDPYLLLEHPEKKGIAVYVPYRALLPKGIEGMLVTGLSISAHRDAVPLIRMQADIQNGGYAAGTAAAMAAATGELVRYIDVDKLQHELVKIGNLPDTVIRDVDPYPLPDERLAEAVGSLPKGRGAAVIMSAPDRAVPLLRAALADASGRDKLVYAKALAVLGEKDGVEDLIAQVRSMTKWDAGWNYRAMGQFGAALSPLDSWIIALGRAHDRRAIEAIVEKASLLDARSDFSHHRAVALALELIGDHAAAAPLAQLLAKPGMTGYVHDSLDAARKWSVPGGTNAVRSRRESLRELMLARALYRCGDEHGLGEKILRRYTRDLRGHLARHAQAVLRQGETRLEGAARK